MFRIVYGTFFWESAADVKNLLEIKPPLEHLCFQYYSKFQLYKVQPVKMAKDEDRQYHTYKPIPQFGRAFKNAPEESNAQNSRVYQTYRPIPQFGRDGAVLGVSDTKQYLPYRPLSAQFGREDEVSKESNEVSEESNEVSEESMESEETNTKQYFPYGSLSTQFGRSAEVPARESHLVSFYIVIFGMIVIFLLSWIVISICFIWLKIRKELV